MIAPTQPTVRTEPATGQSFECWLGEGLSAYGTGAALQFTITYYPSVVEPSRLPSLIAHGYGITDPEAGFRLKEGELLDWTKNLHALNTVASVIFPGIRELTEPEQRNLRSIYRKLYRKV